MFPELGGILGQRGVGALSVRHRLADLVLDRFHGAVGAFGDQFQLGIGLVLNDFHVSIGLVDIGVHAVVIGGQVTVESLDFGIVGVHRVGIVAGADIGAVSLVGWRHHDVHLGLLALWIGIAIRQGRLCQSNRNA